MGKGRKKHSENGGRKPRGYKSSVPTHQFCFDVVLYFEDHSMDVTLSKFYKDLEGSQLQTKCTSVYLWRKKKGKLVELCNSTGTARLRKSESEALPQRLFLTLPSPCISCQDQIEPNDYNKALQAFSVQVKQKMAKQARRC
ncbi:hypothetical protein Pcac1_g21546 [Phytophthora cactorum]|uniref:Uncharacterized protein n=1 Tax=Phytophthora cactorum TaxID=29920 RepID=A0A8T1DH67_9STRA|nr:hypothetical protein Pcac1_g21546 [Phytophthora cactorum]KAG2939073.1 hypothetical protein PC115_g3301 [Phytophthora cactorum]